MLPAGGESSGKAVSTGTWSNLSLHMEQFGGFSPPFLDKYKLEMLFLLLHRALEADVVLVGHGQELPSGLHLPCLSHPSFQLLGLDPSFSGEGLEWCLSGFYHGWLPSSPLWVSPIPVSKQRYQHYTLARVWEGSCDFLSNVW